MSLFSWVLGVFCLVAGSEAAYAKGAKFSLSVVGGLQLPYQLRFSTDRNSQVQTGLDYWTGVGFGGMSGFSMKLFDKVIVDTLVQNYSMLKDDPSSTEVGAADIETSESSLFVPLMYSQETRYGNVAYGIFYSSGLNSQTDDNFGVTVQYRAESDKHRFLAQVRAFWGLNIDSDNRTMNAFTAELGFRLF